MRKNFTQFLKKIVCLFVISIFLFTRIAAQTNCVPITTGIPLNLSLGCGGACTNLTLSVPHIKQTSDYAVQSIPYTPEPYTTTAGIELASLYSDDVFSPLFNLPFSFCFYDSSYTSFVVGSNGLITFDPANQAITSCNNAFGLAAGQPLPFAQAGVTPCGGIFTPYYPKASIMGAYYDIWPVNGEGGPNKKIEYRIEGVAPCRKLIVSYYDCAMFSCSTLICSQQIICHEGTGIIEVFIGNKPSCPAWNSDLALLGIQNWYRDKGVAAPGKNDAVWTSTNEGYRFLPIGGPSRFIKSELLLNNVVVATGDTSTVVTNELQINFPNVCPATIVSQYVIRTEFVNCTDPNNPLERYDTVNITKTAALPGTTTPSSTTCNGTTGTILVTAGAGVAPFTFTLTGPGGPYAPQVSATNSTTFTGLGVGLYTINITDALGCTGSVTETVDNLLSLTGTFISIGASCPTVNNGSLTITPDLAAAGPFNFTLTGPGGPYTQLNVATATFTGLAGGTYSVTFSNTSGCSGTINNMIVGPGSAITSTSNTNGTSCVGQNNGSTTITPTSGTAPYTFSIDGGASQPTGVFTGLTPGSHTVTITDFAGCTGTKTVFVFTGGGITSNISSTGTSCPGVNNGTITLTPLNGTGPFTYSLDGGASLPGNPITGVAAGIHNITITDATGCTGTNSAAVSIGIGNTGTISSTGASCPGINDGTITATATSGTAPFTYTLDGGTVYPTGNISGVSAGPHTVVIADFNGCSISLSTTVTAGPAVTGSAIATNTSCPGVNDGTITVLPGGIAPYTYTLTSASTGTIVQPNNPVFTNLPPDTYTITFTTGSGCNGTVTSPSPLVVLAGPPLTSSFTQFDPPCANINNGTITINPGGVAPYAYVLTGPGGPYNQATPTFSNLAPGVYNYSFTDGNGCTGTGGPVTLVTNAPITTTVTLTMPLCNGGSTGIITLNPSGGVVPYEYALSPFAVYQPSGTFNNLATGTYTFRIRDFAGCTKDTTVTLGEPTFLTASASNTATASCSGNDGTITVTGLGGTPAYQYSIDNGVNYQSSNVFIAPAVGAYPNIKVKDANGCIANTSTTVVLVDAMFLTLGPDTTICVGSSVKMLPQTSAGTSIYNWRPLDPVITNPNTIDTSTIRNATMTPSDTATYILNARWGACVREDTIVVNVLHKPIPNAGLDTAICNQTYAILRGSATNLSGPVYYVWTPAGSVQDDSSAVTIATPGSISQVYTLTVTDNYGCNFLVRDSVLITVQPPVPAYAGNDTTAILGVPHQLFGSGGVDYLWSPSFPLNLATQQNPLATLTNDQQFVLQVTDIAGCIGYDTVFVQVYVGPTYYIPNAFSPNGDGLNDIFRAVPVGIAKTDWFRVFNRYGQLVFETNEWLKGWDGKFQGRAQPMGVYVWIIKGVDKGGRVVEMKGTVMLVK